MWVSPWVEDFYMLFNISVTDSNALRKHTRAYYQHHQPASPLPCKWKRRRHYNWGVLLLPGTRVLDIYKKSHWNLSKHLMHYFMSVFNARKNIKLRKIKAVSRTTEPRIVELRFHRGSIWPYPEGRENWISITLISDLP